MDKPIDLHVHSTRSDGALSPVSLVDYASKKGLAAFALTDHDSVDGLEEAISYADTLRLSNPEIPKVIAGIEFSTEYLGRDVHILGLDIDYHSEKFCLALQNFIQSRTLRNQKMCSLLREGAQIDISYEKLLAEFPDSVITRAHYARYLLQHGYVKSIKEAFDRYVGDYCPYFVPREKVTPFQAVELILEAGGIPVLAHPLLYHLGKNSLEKLTAELTNAGLMGLEAIYATHSAGEEREMRALAAKYDLALSGGSDFHGNNKPKLDLGTGYGSLYIPYEVWTNLIAKRKTSLSPAK